MSNLLQPESLDELVDAIGGADCALAVGRRTKAPLSAGTGATLVSLDRMTGIVQYEPSEFTFTARAGTPIAEVREVLARKRQYLPFDPPLVEAGATLGGTVAAGLSGPGRARYGGLRDFLLGVQFLSGDSQVIHSGGKVVKNAAGFDIPKLLVGSLGRLGVMIEMTFKVFPQSPSLHTYQIVCDTHESAIARIVAAASSRWELDAIDYHPNGRTLSLRVGHADATNRQIADKIRGAWDCDLQRLEEDKAHQLWRSIGELDWLPDRCDAVDQDSSSRWMVKVPTTPHQFLRLIPKLDGQSALDCHLSAAAAVLWISADTSEALDFLDRALTECTLSGLVIRGAGDRIWLGSQTGSQMAGGIKHAMDPVDKFPDFVKN